MQTISFIDQKQYLVIRIPKYILKNNKATYNDIWNVNKLFTKQFYYSFSV